MVAEIHSEVAFLTGGKSVKPSLRTIYFGGGTPSLLNVDEFHLLFDAIWSSYDTSCLKEVTLEANPDDLTPEYLQGLRTLPFNRISMGVQSLDDAALHRINRRHTAFQAKQAVADCMAAGFTNISIDLMYGLPGQTVDQFRQTVQEAVELPVTHISSYALSWEEGSVLYKRLQQGVLKQASDEMLEACYLELNRLLAEKGFMRYELSNFAQPGYESKHNSSYWDGTPYLGIGPSAHSYNGNMRRMNVASVDRYVEGIVSGKAIREEELLDENTQYNDFIMTRLRTTQGIDLSELERLFGPSKRMHCLSNAQKSVKNGFLLHEDNGLRLHEKGLFIADTICSDLFWV
jgi:oxygen-independent coproporphyrinogen-3 oxidase